ncbi:hypothetical protein [Oribacterium sp. WCC10]|uniref:hypothetical protein n=1 Tax=Oribacterium sp. WCC10 TaxID=1855343 RepID=UPI0008E589A9|nr:hypothetical protein [Oribacterium sp. WCC10]SFG19766.1 hypothetical protein SAMN05216356_10390 [Oribacterium sp. WCC10]
MNVREIRNPVRFFSIVDRCKGDIELISGAGDCINLRSKVTQMYTLARIFNHGYVRDLELSISDPSDRELFKAL